MEALVRDLRVAVRTLLKSPSFVAAAVGSLALASGANTAIFSLVNAVLLRPIPGLRDTEALVNVHVLRDGEEASGFDGYSYPDYLDYRDRNDALAGLAAFNGRGMSFGEGDRVELVGGQLVTGNYFALMGVRPHLGRLLEAGDDSGADASPVVVLSHGLWQRRLGSDPAIVGRTIRLNGFPFTVVGVAEHGFSGHFTGFPFDLFVPLSAAAQAAPSETLSARDAEWLELVGRLAPGVSVARAQAALQAVAAGLAREHPETHRDRSVSVHTLTGIDDSLLGPVVGFLAILQAIAGLVLGVACVNVTGLLLARASARRKEAAVRLAIGARRRDLVRQLLSEALLLFGLGAAGGLLFSAWTAHLLVGFQPRSPLPLHFDLSLDWRVVAFTAFCTLATAIAFGSIPAWDAARTPLVPALKDLDAGARSRLRQAFVICQVALSLVLLTGAGLFLRALGHARGLDPGFDVDRVQIAGINLSILAREEARGRAFYRQLLQRLESTPGVESASLARVVPLSLGSLGTRIEVEGHEVASRDGFPVDWNAVTPGYFRTLGLPLVAGRTFDASDAEAAPPVAIVNEALARRFWPGQDVLGQRLKRGGAWLRVVGVARDSSYRRLGEQPRPHLYLPFEQSYSPGMTALVRAPSPVPLAAALRREIRALEPDLPILTEMPLREYVGRALVPQQMGGTISSALGGLGLILTTLGIYGLIAHFVVRRRREVGVRVALGAGPRDVTRLFLGEGLRLSLWGVGLGLAGAAAATRLLASFLPGVSPLDPLVFAGTATLMTLAAALASFVPARRAARLDPLLALRE